MRASLVLLMLSMAARPVLAQSEEQLRNYFEGKTVIVKMEMPGSENGVDVFPGTTQPIDFHKHATRLKQFGTALHRGEQVLVTKVKVKKDLIEFQLGGGGYGTFGDDASPYVNVHHASKTEREKNLEKDLEHTKDPEQRRRMKEEIDVLRKDREREDARNEAEVAQAEQTKAANIRERRIEAGSRFNIRFRNGGLPAAAVTPEGVMAALADYVDFAPLAAAIADAGPGPGSIGPRPNELRKGLTVEEADALLGRPESITRRQEGTLDVSTSTYRGPGRTVKAEFVEGVLIRFTISSQ